VQAGLPMARRALRLQHSCWVALMLVTTSPSTLVMSATHLAVWQVCQSEVSHPSQRFPLEQVQHTACQHTATAHKLHAWGGCRGARGNGTSPCPACTTAGQMHAIVSVM
jgi:hypothetical protein